jgi:hypothetical protein
MSGTLHQRRISDVSEFVLSAAEVKAIASGNPRVLRKVELELQLSRMARVRAVHHDTIAALHRRHAGLAWEHAQEQQTIDLLHAALVVIDRTGPFSVRLRATPDAATEMAYDRLVDADAALLGLLRQLMARLTPRSPGIEQVLGTYRGAVVQGEAHPRWGFNAALLVGGQRLFPLFTAEETSPFRSAEARLRQLPQRITTSERRQAEIERQQAEITAELDRLAVWDGQAAYDAAEAELTAINVAFAALEEAASTPTTTPPTTAAAPAAAPTVPTLQLVRQLAALHPDAGAIVPAALITYPAAPDSLAFMPREQARTTAAISVTVAPVPAASAAATAHPTPIAVVTVVPTARKGHPVSTAAEQFAWDF